MFLFFKRVQFDSFLCVFALSKIIIEPFYKKRKRSFSFIFKDKRRTHLESSAILPNWVFFYLFLPANQSQQQSAAFFPFQRLRWKCVGRVAVPYCIAATMNGSLCWQICHRCSAHGKCHIVSTAFALVGTFQLWTALPSLFANPMFLVLFSGSGGQSSPLGWPCTRVEGSLGTFFIRSYWAFGVAAVGAYFMHRPVNEKRCSLSLPYPIDIFICLCHSVPLLHMHPKNGVHGTSADQTCTVHLMAPINV